MRIFTRRERQSQRGFSPIMRSLLVLILFYSLSASRASSTDNALQEFLHARSGPSGHSIWSYQGALYDPLNGNKIANVQGLELVRCLAETDGSAVQKKRFRRRCGDLAAPTSVGKPATLIDYAGTLLSRKLFCYTPINDDKSLLQSIRLRPKSPLQTIPLDQAAAVYDTATTFVQRGTDWVVHTEWPDGRAVCTTTQIDASTEEDWRIHWKHARSIGFTSYARPQAKGRLRLPDLTLPIPSSSSSNTQQPSAGTISPKRSSIIQFGASKAETLGKFGARETYLYQILNDNTCTVRYTRYGEGPIWYGPGRMCTLELTGKRVQDMSELPTLVAKLAAERVLGFFAIRDLPAPAQDTVMAQRCVEWFRGKGHGPVQIAPHASDMPKRWWHRVQDSSAATWNKVSSTMSWSR
jgi:hypothetical protein